MNHTILVLNSLLEHCFDDIQNEVLMCMDTLQLSSHICLSKTDDEATIKLAKSVKGWLMGWLSDERWLNLGLFVNRETLSTADYCSVLSGCITKTILPECRIMIGLSWLKSGCNVPDHVDQYTDPPLGCTYRVFLYGIHVPENCWVKAHNTLWTPRERMFIEIKDNASYSLWNESEGDWVFLYLKVLDKV